MGVLELVKHGDTTFVFDKRLYLPLPVTSLVRTGTS